MHLSHLESDLREQAVRLRRRYRLFFRVDLVLHVLYALTAALPAWSVIHYQKHILFDGFAIISILAVSALGILANLRLLHGKSRGFALGVASTIAFLITRVALVAWAWFGIVGMSFDDLFYYHVEVNILILLIFTIYLFYRTIYHISSYCHTRMFLHPHPDS